MVNKHRQVLSLFGRNLSPVLAEVGNLQTDRIVFSDEILNYDNEYHSGHLIIAVRAPEREEEALTILRVNGAHN